MPPKQKALEKAAANAEVKAAKAAQEAERAEAANWAQGAKGNSKQKAAEDKEMERARKQQEVAALRAAEEADLGSIVTTKKTKKKGKDDFDMLNAALAAAPKSKAQKEKEAKKKEADERKAKQAKEQAEREARRKAEQDEVRKAAAKGIVLNHTDELMLHNPAEVNKLDEDEIAASGMNAAMDALSMGASGGARSPGGGKVGENRKALYNAYYERVLPQFKEDYPGLKLSQYKERIFESWRTSPENPDNAQR
jgi:hypothetical protein